MTKKTTESPSENPQEGHISTPTSEFQSLDAQIDSKCLAKEEEAVLRQEWATPDDFWACIKNEFKPLVDVCATRANTKCQYYFGPPTYSPPIKHGLVTMWGNDGLSSDPPYSEWNKYHSPFCVAWCNPGFSNVHPWLLKAKSEATRGTTTLVLTHVQPETVWWQDALTFSAECRILIPRIQFIPAPGIKKSSNSCANALWVIRPNRPNIGCHETYWRWK